MLTNSFSGHDEWLTCDLTFFSTVSQSYQDDGRMMVKGCVQWKPVYGWEDFVSSELELTSARLVGQRLTHWDTEAPMTVITHNRNTALERSLIDYCSGRGLSIELSCTLIKINNNNKQEPMGHKTHCRAPIQNSHHLLFGLAWWFMHVRFEITHFFSRVFSYKPRLVSVY